MRAKRKNVCQECRSRKLACDGKSPACSQCTLRTIACTGYRQEFLFVTSYIGTRKRAEIEDRRKTVSVYSQKKLVDSENNAQLIRGFHLASRLEVGALPTATNYHELDADVDYIVQHFAPLSSCDSAEFNPFHNQICGAWVEALPYLATTEENNTFLFFAIKTLATSLRWFCPTRKSRASHPLEMYCKSLGLMSEALEEAQGVFQIQHCVAIMCLAVSDIMIPDLGSGWATHVKGVGNWVKSLGPDSFSSGILRILFVGFRPLLLISSIYNRQTTFLAHEDWTTKPFDGKTISMMQQLLNRASKIPGLLEKFDSINGSLERANYAAIEKLRQDFRDIIENLQEWESSQWSQAPLWWWRPNHNTSTSPDAKDLWFPNLMAANSLTHYWAFMIVVKSHLSVLETALTAREGGNPRRSSSPPSDSVTEISVATLAGRICDSITYLLQPEMKLYGPGSSFFTLFTAFQVFRSDRDRYSVQILRCKKITAQLAARGLHSLRV
ncbi:hypothetical protein BKA63DRAFT_506770 [Paraphoma chrysanthemicola]|nr:hypothetical protein BKA63DRAFT_506770 [Paraphoma chrysanthemicola]